MKRLIISANIVLGVLVLFAFFLALGFALIEKEKVSIQDVSMSARRAPLVKSQEELSLPHSEKLEGESIMKGPKLPKVGEFFPKTQETIREAWIEAPIKAAEVNVSKKNPDIVAYILGKNNLAPKAISTKKNLLKLGPVANLTINVASFRDKENADRYVEELNEKGLDAFAWMVNLPKKERWYRVSIGSFSSRQKAENYKKKLTQKGISDTWITEIPEPL